ncbi:MAG: alcohol dehydrogenase catalytic domain-containing protein [Tepidisphaera sp.]
MSPHVQPGTINAPDRTATPLAKVRVVRALATSVDAAPLATARTIAPGHLGAGVVESVEGSAELAARWVGKRVTWNPVAACARCDRCRAGLSAHCEERTVLGFGVRAGCLAAGVVVPARDLIEVPAKVDDDRAAFAGLVGAVLQLGHAVRLDGKTFVTVLGDGPVGLLTAQIMAGRNASVRLLGRHEARFSLAERWGVKHRHESEVGRRHDQDIVIDCTGSPSGLALASRLVRPRGTIVIKGPPHADALPEEKLWPADLAPLIAAEVTLKHVSAVSTREGLDAVASGAVDVLALAAKRFTLASVGKALAAARDRQIAAVIVEA